MVHDIAWMRLELWRELLAGLFDHPLLQPELRRLTSIRVDVARPGSVTRLTRAALFIGWLAAMLDWLGLLAAIATVTGPLMSLFHLPSEAALPVVVSTIRKDGILLFASNGVVGALSPGQILTAVYLAGVLLPCLVTALTIGRERSPRFVVRLLGRQALAAVAFTQVLGWTVALLGI